MKNSSAPFTILFLEDNVVSAKVLQARLRKEMPSVRFLHGKTIAEAHLLTAEFEADLFILDVVLPDGSGLDFLADVQTINPDASVILMSATDTKRLKQMRLENGAPHFFAKPLDLRAVVALVRHYVDEQGREPALIAENAAPTGFSARLQETGALEVIQFRCMTRATAMLEFSTPELVAGLVHLSEGQIIHAETGDLLGMEALVEILSWEGGAMREVPGLHSEVRSIAGSSELLLMHAAQEIDESRALASASH